MVEPGPIALTVGAGVDTAWVRDCMRQAGKDPEALPADTLLDPAAVAETCWMLHHQPRNAWTFEMDGRPFAETW